MTIYMAWIWDAWWEQQIPVGCFMTEQEAEDAVDILLKRCGNGLTEEQKKSRFDISIYESMLGRIMPETVSFIAD